MSQSCKDQLRNAILEEFTRDRNGNVVDRQLMTRVIKTYVQLGLKNAKPVKTEIGFFWEGNKDLEFYTNQFEAPFVKRASQEYDVKAKNHIAESTAPEYLRWADTCFLQEEGYCDNMLQSETREKLMTTVELELVTKRNQQIVDKDTGVKYMVDNQRQDELLMLYRCFSRQEGNLTVVVQCLQNYIEVNGAKIVQDATNLADPILFT